MSATDKEAEAFLLAKRRLQTSLLAIFPAAMLGRRVNVTLLDDTLVMGRMSNVDGFFNIELDAGVTVIVPGGGCKQFMETMHISGKRVRYVGLPKSLDVHCAIDKHLKVVVTNKAFGGQRKLRKDRYAYLRQQPSSNLFKRATGLENESKSTGEPSA